MSISLLSAPGCKVTSAAYKSTVSLSIYMFIAQKINKMMHSVISEKSKIVSSVFYWPFQGCGNENQSLRKKTSIEITRSS